MRQLTAAALMLAFVGLASMARTEDKANPNGTWKWTVNFGGQERELAVKLLLKNRSQLAFPVRVGCQPCFLDTY